MRAGDYIACPYMYSHMAGVYGHLCPDRSIKHHITVHEDRTVTESHQIMLDKVVEFDPPEKWDANLLDAHHIERISMQKYYDLVEDSDDNKAEPGEIDKKILTFLAMHSYSALESRMIDSCEPYTHLKIWAEDQLGVMRQDNLYIGYAIQAIVDDKSDA